MFTSENIIETVNCVFEACIVIFYLYQIMKEQYRYTPKFLVIPAVGMFGVLVSVTLADANPWLKLVLIRDNV